MKLSSLITLAKLLALWLIVTLLFCMALVGLVILLNALLPGIIYV